MPDYRLRIGMRFKRQGKEFAIEERLGNGDLRIRDVARDVCDAKPVGELVDELFAGKLELIGEENYRGNLEDRLSKSRVTDLSQLDDQDPLKLEIVRRFNYVQEIISSQPPARTNEHLGPIIQWVSHRIEDSRAPSWTTVNRWLRAYESSGRDVRSLASGRSARGNCTQKISEKSLSKFTEEDYEKAEIVGAIVGGRIRTKYLTLERPTVQSIHDDVVKIVSEENSYREPHDKLPIPDISSLYKRVNELDPYEVACKRYGKKYAEQKYRENKQGPRPSRPLERVECDHTKIDMMVIDDKTGLPLGRPWLTAIIDVFTKMILGIYLSFHQPSSFSVMQCLLHAIRPKPYLKAVYPAVKNDWPTYGIPEVIVVDNGREFHGSHFKDACLQLGIEIQYSPPGKAWFRATGERWFGTLNKQLLHELPGTTFSNIFDKQDYDPKQHALISLESLLEIIHIWIVDVYHKRVHRGIQDVPYRRWTESIIKSPPNLPPASTELEVLIGFVEHRSISRSGIELFSLYYNSSELSLLRRTLGNGEKGMLKYDPTDISVIYVWDKVKAKFLIVPALDQDYTKNLTVWQHKVIKRYARLYIKDHVDIVALCQAKATIQKIVDRERLVRKSTGGKQKIAHYLNLGQPNYEKVSQSKSTNRDDLTSQQQIEDSSRPLLLHGSPLAENPETEENTPQYDKVLNRGDGGADHEYAAEDEGGWSADYDLPGEA